MTDDELLLASSYLDDDLDASERARAEADPEVMAEVARLADVRERLRAVDPPDAARRDAAIAAALAGTAPSTAVAPTPLRRRRTWLPVSAAAAVIAIAIAGVAILANRSGGDDSGTASVSATLSPLAADEAAPDRAPFAGGGAATTAGAAAAATAAASATTAAATTAAKAPAAAPAPSTVVLDSPAALAAFATGNPLARLHAATTPPTCTGGRYVGRADYERGGQMIPVEVFVQDREALARDATTCAEVARAALP